MTLRRRRKGRKVGMASSKVSPERRVEISRMGGRAVQAAGTGYRFNSETGKAAGLRLAELVRLGKLAIKRPAPLPTAPMPSSEKWKEVLALMEEEE